MAFTFPVFTPDFCHTLLEELENYENTDLPKGRPNTMNRGGVREGAEEEGGREQRRREEESRGEGGREQGMKKK